MRGGRLQGPIFTFPSAVSDVRSGGLCMSDFSLSSWNLRPQVDAFYLSIYSLMLTLKSII